MLTTIPTLRSSGSEISAYARPFWEKATGHGTENATTSFHLQYNKRDIHRVRGRNDRYTGDRAMSIGYMKGGVKMMKFLTSDEGRSLVGVDCSKPGSGGQARQDRIRSVGDEFLALAAYYSKKREYERGDVEAVAEARDMDPSTFATFVGFSYAIVSPEFKALKTKWYNDERAELEGSQPQVAPVSQATPLAVVVGVEVPAAAAPAAAPERPLRNPSVVDMDSSEGDEDDEEEEELPAAPPPPPAPPLPLPPYNDETKQIFKLMIKVLLRDPVTVETAKPELRDLANTIDGMSYPAHMRRVQQLIGAPRLGEIMRALEAGAAASAPAPAPGPADRATVHVDHKGLETIPTVSVQSITTPEQHRAQASNADPEYDASVALAMQLQEEEESFAASARAPAPVEEQDSEEVLNRKIFGNDAADDDASDRSVTAAALAASKPASKRTVKFAPAPALAPAKRMPKPIPKPAKPVPNPKPPKATKRPAPPNMQPAKGPRKKQASEIDATNDREKFFTDGEWRALGTEILCAYDAAKAAYKTNVYDAENTPLLNAQTSLYHIDTKRRMDGKSAGQQDTDVLFALHSPLHKILKKTKLRSVPDIKRAFGLP